MAAAAISHHIPLIVNHLLSYLRQEQLSLMSLPTDALIDGRIKWGPVPRWIIDDTILRVDATSTKLEEGKTYLKYP